MHNLAIFACRDFKKFRQQTSDNRLLSKREVKIATVEWAISALLAVESVEKKNGKNR